MLTAAIITGVCILGGMSYLALSKKTNQKIRTASLISLGIMILATIVCLIIISNEGFAIVGSKVSWGKDVPAHTVRPAGNSYIILGCIIFLLLFFVFILVISLREQKKYKKEKSKTPFKF